MKALALMLLLGAGGSPVRPLHEVPEAMSGQLVAGERPTDPSAPLPRFEPGETVESLVSPGGRFRLHFSRSGPNAVAAADSDGNGVPDSVEVAARMYDRVAAFYGGLGYRLPPEDTALPGGSNGGDEKFDVYLVDFALRADGAYRMDGCLGVGTNCVGHILQENDFVGYSYRSYEEAVATLASHEFFHAVQAVYHTGLGIVAGEGTAVWATERFEPALDDLEHFSSSYMTRPDRTLVVDPDGPAQSFSYGSSLFFQFLGERFGDGLIRSLWEESVLSPSAPWPELLETCLRRDWGSDFDRAFAEFAQWNLSTGSHWQAGPGGYARGAGYAELVLAPKALPVDETSVRVAPAATRYFEVAGGAETVSVVFLPREGDETGALHLMVAAHAPQAVLRVARAEGLGPLTVQLPAQDATRVSVAVVDGRRQGTGRYGRLCVAHSATATPCGELSPDAGTPDGGGTPEEPQEPGPSKGCQAAPGGWWVGMLLAGGLLRMRRRTSSRLLAGPPAGAGQRADEG
ncbi:hypothetical protein POL68_03290 [Stigmatella sp. ncwal1]|uniref:Uncharacterized protein n=1 Tax=Stigmatella ashevillensis TaxID=2995309 RepID=A0ABT5D1E9_9BACT|nr:MXAN_6640 family putative metalloprotease [Stigmatella ashevillena]MDC0707486.1 hypothetical protein [Stigmatella ashevillena]